MADHGEDRNNLAAWGKIIWQQKWMVGLFAAVVTLAVLAVSYLVTPVYEASGTVHLKEPKPSLLGDNSLSAGISALSTKEEINTQIEILKSRRMLEEVIQDQNLLQAYGLDQQMDSELRLQLALGKLRKDITVSNIANTRLIKVAVRSTNPVLAARIANSLVRLFIERDMESKRGEANAVLGFVTGQVAEVSERLNQAEEDLLQYKKAQGIGVLEEEARLTVGLLSQLESSFQQVRVDREVLSTRIAAVLGQIVGGSSSDGSLAGVSRNPVVSRMQGELTANQLELARLESSSSVTPHQEAEVKERIDGLKRDIQAEIERAVRSARSTAVNSTLQMQLAEYETKDVILAAQENALQKLIEAHEGKISKLPAREINLIRLERARRINDELYAALMRAKNEAQIEAASQIANIDIVDPAIAPLKPVRPKRKESLLIGLAASLILGICLAFLLEYLDQTVKSDEEARRILGVPILGQIPRFQGNDEGRRIKRRYQGKNHLALFSRDDPQSPVSEAIKLLRANLHFLDLDRALKTIVVTSPVPGDGKTTIAANLSIVLAAQEEKILIVDSDFRAPAIHRIFNLAESPGIVEALLQGLDHKNVVQKIEGIDNLDIITTGSVPPNATELLGSTRMKNLVEQMKRDYDRIVFDVPPVLVATDAVDLGSEQDGVLLVVKMNGLDRRILSRAKELLANTRVRLLGAILNQVDIKDKRYGYGYYYPKY
jgi:succinoglycan biosynthesis transport protein ExoP